MQYIRQDLFLGSWIRHFNYQWMAWLVGLKYEQVRNDVVLPGNGLKSVRSIVFWTDLTQGQKWIKNWVIQNFYNKQDFFKYIFEIYGYKVAQLVRCRTSNQRIAGLFLGHSGHFGRSWAKQFIPYIASVYPAAKWVPSINKVLLRVCALYAASCSGISPGGLKWFQCVQCLLWEEGRVSASVDTRL